MAVKCFRYQAINTSEMKLPPKLIYERYAKNPIVHDAKAKIHFDGEQLLFHWVLQDDDTWPYYFGAVQAEFEIMPIERVSKYT